MGAILGAMGLGAVSLLLIVVGMLKRGIKLDTIVLVAKACCYMILGFFTPLTVGLAQWANSGEFPGPLIWIVMFASCVVGMASQLLSFMSGSYGDYLSSRKSQSNGNQPSFDTQTFKQASPTPSGPSNPPPPTPAVPASASQIVTSLASGKL